MSLKAKRHQWSLQKSNFQDDLQNIAESNQTLSSWHFIQLTEQRFPMKQLFVRKYKQDFQQRLSPILIENRELQDKITEMKSWEGNNYYYLIETRHSTKWQPFVIAWSKVCSYICLRRITKLLPFLLRWSIL